MAIELATDTEATAPLVHRLVLLLEDNLATGELEVEAHMHPPEVNPNSPAHIVGVWLKDNMEQIVQAANQQWLRQQRLATNHQQLDLFKPANQLGVDVSEASIVVVDASGRKVVGKP